MKNDNTVTAMEEYAKQYKDRIKELEQQLRHTLATTSI